MNLENRMFSKRRQTPKTTDCMILVIHTSRVGKLEETRSGLTVAEGWIKCPKVDRGDGGKYL